MDFSCIKLHCIAPLSPQFRPGGRIFSPMKGMWQEVVIQEIRRFGLSCITLTIRRACKEEGATGSRLRRLACPDPVGILSAAAPCIAVFVE